MTNSPTSSDKKQVVILSLLFTFSLLSISPGIIFPSTAFIGWVGSALLSFFLIIQQKTNITFPKPLFGYLLFLIYINLHIAIFGSSASLTSYLLLTLPIFSIWSGYLFSPSVFLLKKVDKILSITSILAVLIFIWQKLKYGNIGFAAEGIFFVLLITMHLIAYEYSRKKLNIALLFCLFSILVINANRGAAAAALLTLTIWLLFRYSGRLKILLLALITFTFFGIFQSSAFQQKTFVTGSGTFVDLLQFEGTVNTSGRADAWSALLDKISKQPFFGDHFGSSSSYLSVEISTAFSHPHNDYLRIIGDFGIVGLAIYMFGHLFLIFRISKKRTPDYFSTTSRWLYIPYFSLMFVDNIIFYISFWGAVHFFIVGLSLRKQTRPSLRA